MARWIDAGPAHEVPEDRPLGRTIEGVRLVLLRRGDRVVAVEDRCPHMTFPLSEGHLRDGRLVCALHRWEFDVFGDDEREAPPEMKCRHHRVRRRDERIEVDLELS